MLCDACVCAVVLCLDAAIPCVRRCIANPGSEFMLAKMTNQFIQFMLGRIIITVTDSPSPSPSYHQRRHRHDSSILIIIIISTNGASHHPHSSSISITIMNHDSSAVRAVHALFNSSLLWFGAVISCFLFVYVFLKH